MEHISNLTLSHFRSHKVSKLSLDGRPVVVFGKNGTGKTNILEAVSLFSPGRGLRRATAEDITRNPEAIGWKIEGKVKNRISEYEVVISSENSESRRLLLDGKKVTYDEVHKNLSVRDFDDTTRDINPLIKAKNAIVIDNTSLNFAQQNKLIFNYIHDATN